MGRPPFPPPHHGDRGRPDHGPSRDWDMKRPGPGGYGPPPFPPFGNRGPVR